MSKRINFDPGHNLLEPRGLKDPGMVLSLNDPGATDGMRRGVPSKLDLYQQSNLTTNQLQVWIAQALLPDNPIYNLATALDIRGKIEPEHFQAAFQVLLNSSDALRTVVEEADGIPRQRVLPELRYDLEFFDFSHLSDKQQSVKAWMEARGQLRLISHERLFDSALIRLAAKHFVWYLNVHHLICDGWSYELIYRHMSELYGKSVNGCLPQSLSLFPFADYVEHQRSVTRSSRHQRAQAYWKQRLAEDQELNFFYGRVPEMPTTRTRRVSHGLGLDVTRKIRSAAASDSSATERGRPLLDVFVTLFVAYLHCLNRRQSYTIGIPFHNRRSKQFKETIGFFSEILPVRIVVENGDTFATLIDKVKDEAFKAARHGQYSIANSQSQRIYDVTVNYHTRSFCEFAGMPASPQWIHNGHGDDSLALQVHDFGASGELVLDFDTHRTTFNEEDSKQVVRYFSRVIEAFIANPHLPLRDLRLLSPAESQSLVAKWNRGVVERTARRCVPEIFEEQVAARPNQVAIVSQDRQLTYSELNQHANQLAHFLRKRGVGANSLVALYTERSPEMLVGLLGVLKAGAAYVPLDPKNPHEWLRLVLEETRVSILLTQQKLLAEQPSHGIEVICLDSPCDKYRQESKENLNPGPEAEHLAYVIYTSGSTGAPKGVEIPHRALTNFTTQAARYFELRHSDRILQFASISFDTAVEEIFPCLTSGATLVLRTDDMLDSPSAFLERCKNWGITVLDLPTVYWHELTAALLSEQLTLPDPIRLVIIGGERALPERLAQWRARVPKRVRLLNTYGPTEATVAATMCELTNFSAEEDFSSEVPIGRPIPNVETYVLDQDLKPVPAGVPGELYIGGVGLARGYLNRPDLTAERFLPNPLRKTNKSRLYKTGDLVRHRSDGTLEFLGRIDRQVKVRGIRVELDGIEAILRSHPLIEQAAVVQDSASKQLVACLVPNSAAALNMDEVRTYSTKRMPEYMVPARLLVLDSLPVSPNGKVDLQRIAVSHDIQRVAAETYTAPQSALEQQVAQIWSDVLRLDRVGRKDHFFQLGGHSLLAIQVLSRIRRQFAIDIPLQAIFEAPTVAALAEQVEAAMGDVKKSEESGAGTAEPLPEGLPLSFSQERIWFMDQLAPHSAAYNMVATLRLTGTLNKEALKYSLAQVVQRHASLRTTFQKREGEPIQVVADELALEIPEVDLRRKPEAMRIEEAKTLLRSEASRPFDLEHGPLLRVLLAQLDQEDWVLLLNMHHAISDQWSVGLIAQEITSLYEAFCKGGIFPADPVPTQYIDFAVSQRKLLNAERWKALLAYWKKQLSELAPLELPTDYPRPSTQTFRGAHAQVSLSRDMVAGLRNLGLQENATLFMAFLAGFKTLMSRYSGQEDIAIGSPIANRNRVEWERVVGTFINVLLLRTDLSGKPTFRELLRRVREVVLEAFAHQEMPFEKLVQELQPKRDTSRSPLLQVLFTFHTPPPGKFDFSGLSWAPFEIDAWASQFDLAVTIDPEITHKIWIAYNTDLFQADTIARLLKHYCRILEQALRDPDRPVTEFSILTEPEHHQIVRQWNDTNKNYPRDKCVHELFEAQVERLPDAPAVVFEGQQLTYRQLNQRGNRIAHYLRQLGVGPEVVVGLYVERSIDMLAALLGILKAGGAYLPIDPACPPERMSFMIEDSGMGFLLTQGSLLTNLPQGKYRAVALDSLREQTDAETLENSRSFVQPENLAYVIYTSGSTGMPKGVQIEHKALVNFLHSMREELGLTKEDLSLSITTVSFDIAALELFLPLLVGARILLIDRQVAYDGRRLRKELEASPVTIMQATPATWQMLLEAGWKGRPDLKILCGGESLRLDLAKALAERGHTAWNLYGPTETTVWSTAWRIDGAYGRVSIGRPIANTQIYILDADLNPVPIGVSGEVHIGGAGVARGYLNRPDLTAEKFIADPFGSDPKTRLYRTGDYARYLPDGNIEFVGRKDDQVKIRGFRVELGEIEASLNQHPEVRRAVVLTREDLPGDKRLIAYVVPDREQIPTTSDLRAFLRSKLPQHMIPSAVVTLESLPVTPHGKLDRQALPVPDPIGSERGNGFVAARDPMEHQLIQIWEQLLGTGPIGVNEDFFEMGGHSLMAVRLIARLEQAFGTNLALHSIFQAPTVAQLADFIRDGQPSRRWSSLVPLQTHGTKLPFFWVHGDTSNAFLARHLGPDQPLYALEHQSQDGKPARFTSVEAIAAHYLLEIQSIQAQGPYYLGGYSFGAIVAFEIAQQLREQAAAVSLLVLLDPPEPVGGLSKSASSRSLETGPKLFKLIQDRVRRHYVNLSVLESRDKLAYVGDRAKSRIDEGRSRVQNILNKALTKACLVLGKDLPPAVRSQYILDIYSRARPAYPMRAYSGRVAVFTGESVSDDYVVNWRKYLTGETEFYEVSGDHLEIRRKPYIDSWAKKLKTLLEAAQAVEGHVPSPASANDKRLAGRSLIPESPLSRLP